MAPKTKHFFDFANFRLDLLEKVLLCEGKPVPLTPKVFDTLQILIENAGQLVGKEELLEEIWQDRFVEESNLTFNIKMLRKALGDNAAEPRFIETVQRRGYRFIAEVKEVFGEQKKAGQSPSFRAPFTKNKWALMTVSTVLLIATCALGYWYLSKRSRIAAAPVLAAPFALEKLSTNGKVFSAALSPDGKMVVYTNRNENKQSVWLRQLEAENVEIIPPSEDEYFEFKFSPDGNFLYFSRRPHQSEGTAGIYRVSIFGGIPQKIIGEIRTSFSLSLDGGKISFVRCNLRADDYCSVWLADADGKNERKLTVSTRPFRIGSNQISPDGKSIAFAVGQSENAANEFVLRQVDIETGTTRELTSEKFFNIKSLAWLPDQSGLLVTASKIPNHHFRIWQVSTTGDVQPLTNDSETYSVLSLDREGRGLISTQIKKDFGLQLRDLENPSVYRVLTNAGSSSFASNEKIIFSSPMTGNDEIWSINRDGSGQRQLTNNVADDGRPIVSPEDGSIFFSSNRTGEAHVWRMSADGSNQTQITKKEGGFPLFVTPDQRWLYYHHGLNRTLWRVSTAGGNEEMVFNKLKFHFALSPDGSQVALAENRGGDSFLSIISLADGQTIKSFPTAKKVVKLLEMVWLPDGKNLAYTLTDLESNNFSLWLQSVNGGVPRKIADLGNEEVNSPKFAPDGKSFIIIQGGWRHDVVLLKGLR